MAVFLAKTLTKAGIAKSVRVSPLVPLSGLPSDGLSPTPTPSSEGPSPLPGYSWFSEHVTCVCFCMQPSVFSVSKALLCLGNIPQTFFSSWITCHPCWHPRKLSSPLSHNSLKGLYQTLVTVCYCYLFTRARLRVPWQPDGDACDSKATTSTAMGGTQYMLNSVCAMVPWMDGWVDLRNRSSFEGTGWYFLWQWEPSSAGCRDPSGPRELSDELICNALSMTLGRLGCHQAPGTSQLRYHLPGPPSSRWSIVDWNVIMWCIISYYLKSLIILSPFSVGKQIILLPTCNGNVDFFLSNIYYFTLT